MSTTTSSDVRTYGHFVGGEEVGGENGAIERRAPADGTLLARFADGTAEEVQAAVAAARRAFDDGPWRHLSGAERARVLLRWSAAIHKRREELARIDAQEVGKPIRLARGDLDGTVAHFEYAAGLAQELHGDAYTNFGAGALGVFVREPVGVAGQIIPWNFPALDVGQKVPYALASGCSVVFKPSELASGSSVEIARLAADAGVPDGVVNVVTGAGAVGQAIAESPDVDFLSFTGSTATGQRVAAAAAPTAKRVALELGGKSANVVFADADLDDAVDGVLFGAFFMNGECCVAGSRLLVQESIADAFLERVVERARTLRVGDPLDEATDVGPLIHDEHAEKVLGYVASAREEGARLLTGGGRVEGLPGRAYVEPTIFDGVRPDMRVFREEIFGPVLSVTRFAGADDAVALANGTAYGLASSVWTRDVDTAIGMARRFRSGMVWVNTTIDGGPQMPFGGVKASGHGREMGRAGFEEYTELKSIFVRTGRRTPFYA